MIIDELEKLGIRARNKPGEQRVRCPRCSPTRRKKAERCLSVKIDEQAGVYNCWHCGWSGAAFDQRGSRAMGSAKSRAKPGDLGAAGRRLRYGVLS